MIPVTQLMANSSAVRPRRPSSRLFEFDQGAAKVLGVQENHRLAMGAGLGLAVAQDPRALTLEPVAGGDDVIHLETEVVYPAGRVALEKGGDG